MLNVGCHRIYFRFWAILSLMLLCFISPITVAQPTAGIIAAGDAAVTAFGGTVNNPSNNMDLFDLNGPSLRIITLPSSGSFGLVSAQRKFTIKTQAIGQVFGVVLDNAAQPNIYVAATSSYGLAIYKANVGRLQNGEVDAQYLPGQFGPSEQGGGPSSIWKIDGVTGQVTLFANINYNGITQTPASLGGLAFDPASKQIYVADRATGMIHRISLDGVDRGLYDHGVQGLGVAGQPTVPFNPTTIATINNAKFDTKNPDTWGYAPAQRRIYALTVYQGRLYYAVALPQIWSVRINSDGSFANDARLEIDTSALNADTEISAITFDSRGDMYLAERGAPTGDYDFISVAAGGTNRVLRFTPSRNGGGGAAGYWKKPADEYAIGMLKEYQNADGGVALYCDRTVWATGEQLLTAHNGDSFPYIDGLQGTDVKLVKPANTPPTQSWYINYYDVEANQNSHGHMGALVILSRCEGVQAPPTPGGSAPPPVRCPSGTYLVNGVCYIPPVCPPGTEFVYGYCIYVNCPCGYVRINNVCVPPPQICDYGEVYVNDRCYPIGCPPGLTRAIRDYCQCPNNYVYQDGRCVPPPCPPNQTYRDGQCNPCPPNQTYRDGQCRPPHQPCPPSLTYDNGRCVPRNPCRPNQTYTNGRCVTRPSCADNQVLIRGQCITRRQCDGNQVMVDGRCITRNRCGDGMRYVDGRCVRIIQDCPRGQMLRNGECVTRNIDQPPRETPPRERPPREKPDRKKPDREKPDREKPSRESCGKGYYYRHGQCIPIRTYHPIRMPPIIKQFITPPQRTPSYDRPSQRTPSYQPDSNKTMTPRSSNSYNQ